MGTSVSVGVFDRYVVQPGTVLGLKLRTTRVIRLFAAQPQSLAPPPADTNEDGYGKVDDLRLGISQWGMAGSPADISGDGIVGVADLLMVIAAWGHGP